MQSFSPTAVECPKCGLADTEKGYHHEPFQSYLESPLKQTFDHEKYFVKWINNILGINTPKMIFYQHYVNISKRITYQFQSRIYALH